jgi:hypothetical protein
MSTQSIPRWLRRRRPVSPDRPRGPGARWTAACGVARRTGRCCGSAAWEFDPLVKPPTGPDISSEDLATTQRLGDVLARHDNVAVLVGHAHTMATTTFAGVPVLVGGGLISAVTTDAEDMPSIDYTQPPTLHLVQDDHLVTHWRVV